MFVCVTFDNLAHAGLSLVTLFTQTLLQYQRWRNIDANLFLSKFPQPSARHVQILGKVPE